MNNSKRKNRIRWAEGDESAILRTLNFYRFENFNKKVIFDEKNQTSIILIRIILILQFLHTNFRISFIISSILIFLLNPAKKLNDSA
jgi:hypothetical protein